MNISIAGNTSLAYYCLNKLCRGGHKVVDVFICGKNQIQTTDIADFTNLAGEFGLSIIKFPAGNGKAALKETDLLLNLEWPNNLPLPIKPKIGTLTSNLAGQYNGENLYDIAADIYLGRKAIEVQLLLDESRLDDPSANQIIHEPPFFKVLSYAEFELTPLDDLRCAKAKAAGNLWMLLEKAIARIGKAGTIPQPLKREINFSKTRVDRAIDWNKGAMYLHNFIRAFTHPGPGAYTWHDDSRLYVWRGHYFDLAEQYQEDTEPGTIIDIIEELGIVVKTSHGTFLITRIQAAGMPELPAWIWAGDAHIVVGDKFQIINENEKVVA